MSATGDTPLTIHQGQPSIANWRDKVRYVKEKEREEGEKEGRGRDRERFYRPTASTGGSLVELFILVAFCTSHAMWENVKSRWWEGSSSTGSFTFT